MEDLKYLIAVDFGVNLDERTTYVPFKDRELEIIEFPGVLLNLETGEIESEFHAFVKPIEKPILSDYCKSQFGITQAQVDAAELLPVVLSEFNAWIEEQLSKRGLNLPLSYDSRSSANCALVVSSKADLQFVLEKECQKKAVPLPAYFKVWCDTKIKYREAYESINTRDLGCSSKDNPDSQERSIQQQIVRNIADLAYRLAKGGIKFRTTDIMDGPHSDDWYASHPRKHLYEYDSFEEYFYDNFSGDSSDECFYSSDYSHYSPDSD